MNTGTDLKINVHFDPIAGYTMDDIEFTCKFFTNSNVKVVTCTKKDMIRVDEQNYIAIVCTRRVGYGSLKLRVIAEIPDNDVVVHDMVRYEEVQIETGITIGR